MLIKKSKIFKMLITLILTLALVSGIYFVMPKQSKTVSAATAGSSAVLKGYNSVTYDASGFPTCYGLTWYNKLTSPVSKANVTSITITTDSSKITGYAKGANVEDSTSNNDLYYYYKLAGYQVDTNNDGTVDTDGYDIIIYADVETIFAPVYSTRLFEDFRNCKSIDFENFNTSQVTDMCKMFNSCSSLTSLNLSNFNTSQVIDMSTMFCNCSSLTSLGLSKFDTSQVTSMSSMFAGCSSLTSLNLSNFNTSQVTDMCKMFNSCSSLTSLNLSNFNTSQVIDMSTMFCNCSSLTSLGLSKFDTSQVTSMSSMFAGCSSLTSLNLSNFNTSQVTDMCKMFFDCNSLVSLDLSNFNTSQVTNMYSMFGGCSSLTSLNLSSFNTNNVTNMFQMFVGCFSLTSLNVSNFDTSQVTDLSNMFYGCSSLTTLDISSFSFDSVDATDEEATMGMFGMSVAQFGQMLGFEGEELDAFVGLTDEERIELLAEMMGSEEEAQLWYQTYIFSIPKIIAPATIPSDLTISLPGEYNYTGGGDETTSILIAGATHTLPNASNDTSETGVVSTSILVGLIALCFVYSGFMMLKKKKIR